MKTDWQTCWGSTSSLGSVGWRYQTATHEETWGSSDWSENRDRQCIDLLCRSHELLSEGLNHHRVPLWPKHDQNVQGAGMQQYLCFLMPFCGTDPLFFWLPPSTSASLKLDSDPPSPDSSESKPEEDRTTDLRTNRNWTSNHSHRFSLLMSTADNYSSLCTLLLLFTSVIFRELWIKHCLSNICHV